MRKHRRFKQDAELDITAFMNLMIVLVPILLINLIFSQASVLELNFPSGEVLEQLSEDDLELSVVIRSQSLDVTQGNGQLVRSVGRVDGAYLYDELSRVMQEIKLRIPEKKEVTLKPQPDIQYQTIISVMDAVRSYETVVAGSVVDAELFPNIAISAAPVAEARPQEGE